jgi:hypothetical protein
MLLVFRLRALSFCVLSSAFFSLLFSFVFSILWLALLCRACIDCSVLTLFDFFFKLKNTLRRFWRSLFFFGFRGMSERTLGGDHECDVLFGVGVHCRLLVADGRISVEWC